MDIKYLLCEPISKLAMKAPFPEPKDHWLPLYNQSSSPQSICSSLSSSSISSSGSTYENSPPSRRRTLSDIEKDHVFIYSSRRVRSESASSPPTRTPWAPYEDELLRRGYNQGLSWAMISSTYLPHRSRGCCWGRFKTLQNKNLADHTRCFKRPWKSVQFEQNRR
ncbi:hypothetical protein G6F56_001063 [Rhizopus delemar]|nr:hypothetical protein G6F56_001063 [Rhizopus delemar]